MSRKKSNKANKDLIKLIVLCVIGAILVYDLLLPFGGTIRFYVTSINCGQRPVAVRGSGFMNDGVSSYYTPSNLNIFPGQRPYFCTAFDAEKHGYSADPEYYDFPVLKKNNALCQKDTDPKVETAAVFSKCK